jgi:SpoVK/Ycf46/Vps4 family AAA+-type ATPase
MPESVLPSLDQIRDLEILIKAHHPLILIETIEEDRVGTLFEYLADRLGLPMYTWTAHRGLASGKGPPLTGTDAADKMLDFVAQNEAEALYHLRGFTPAFTDPPLAARLKELYRQLFTHRGALIITGAEANPPPDLEALFTVVDLEAPTPHAYYQFVSNVLRDLRKRMDVQIDLSGEDVAVLLSHLRGLTFFEVKKIVTQAVIEDGRLDRSDIEKVLEAKKRAIQRSGVLDYYPADQSLGDLAGLDNLKTWLRKRKNAFQSPDEAKRFGLSAPKGLLLLGVQGCGKSMCAKAVAAEWQLPLIRLDPSSLYNKFVGESEKNLMRAIKTAEQMAPIVLWIDEIEKAFGGSEGGGGSDSGTTSRIFGTFLTWLNDKKESVFVIATANDISRLPPELLRKGRFDEIFFVDLPDAETRAQIFEVHLRRRDRAPEGFDLAALAEATDGFSGAEIEQVVISALYTAFSEGVELNDDLLLEEARGTRPLSVTMGEKIAELRTWADNRAVPA